MKKTDAYNLICKEYLYKCKEHGCDSCIAENYCIEKGLRNTENCVEKLQDYLRTR